MLTRALRSLCVELGGIGVLEKDLHFAPSSPHQALLTIWSDPFLNAPLECSETSRPVPTLVGRRDFGFFNPVEVTYAP